MTNNTDVLVVGAGPTGLIASIFLRLHGVDNVRLIDALQKPSGWAKALAIQQRSLEILKHVGGTTLEELQAHGMLAKGMKIHDYNSRKTLIDIDFNKSKANTKFLLNEQWHDEQVFTKRLEELGVKVERSKKLKSLYDTGSLVEVETEDGERFNAQFVVGCDGAHSFCRHHLGTEFRGEKYNRSYALIQCQIDDMPMDPETVRIDLGNHGWSFISPMKDKSWICVFDLTTEERAQCSPNQPTLDDLYRLLAERGITVKNAHDPIWNTYFNVHSRQAEHYSKGRIFLCGDACHIHSPLGGQGMNMGMQDAHNLAWKLALVVNGQAGLPLLDSYDSERHNVDRDVLKFIDIMNANVSTREAVPRAFMNRAMQNVSSVQFILDTIAVPQVGQQLYNYGFSTLSVESWGRVPLRHLWLRRCQNINRVLQKRIKAGDRIPNWEVGIQQEPSSGNTERVELHEWLVKGGTGFKALVFEGLPTHQLPSDKKDLMAFAKDLQKASCGLISCASVVPVDHDVHGKFGIQGQCLLLIRPDGYLGLRCEPLSVDLTLVYLADVVKATKVRGHGAICKTGPDPIVYVILPTLFSAVGIFGYKMFVQKDQTPLLTKVLGTVLFAYVGYTIAEVGKSWKK